MVAKRANPAASCCGEDGSQPKQKMRHICQNPRKPLFCNDVAACAPMPHPPHRMTDVKLFDSLTSPGPGDCPPTYLSKGL